MYGHGKIILFGEHAVVYGYPALAVGIPKGIRSEVVSYEQEELTLAIPQWQTQVSLNEPGLLSEVFRLVVNQFSSLPYKGQVVVTPEIPSRAGLGSSAAFSVSLIRALAGWCRENWSEEKINQLAFQTECLFHGTPSGLDNTLATFGGYCLLRDEAKFPLSFPARKSFPLRNLTASLLENPLVTPFNLLIVNTHKERQTKKLVAHVRSLYQRNPAHYQQIMTQIGQLTAQGYQALQRGDLQKFGKLLSQNQKYLVELEVSSPEIDFICSESLKLGAWGAKLTGAGGGGCVIVLAPGREKQMQEIFNQYGFSSFITELGSS